MTSRRRALVASLVFFAFTAPFGIAAHLLSELFGLGWHDDADVIFSARHGYLAVLAIVSLGALLTAALSVPRDRRRAQAASLVAALPFSGTGAGFTLTLFLAQFGFFALTQIGEGCPLCGGDVFTGILAAGFAAALGAVTVALCKRRILEFAVALVGAIATLAPAEGITNGVAPYPGARPLAKRRKPFAFRYRPPPIAA